MRWREEVRVTRGTFAVISFAVGLVLAGALWLGWTAADDAGDARSDIRASIKRLDRIENPTAEQIRAFLDRLVRDATPEQRRALERAIERREIVLRRQSPRRRGETPTSPRRRSGPKAPGAQPNSPTAPGPRSPSTPPTPGTPTPSTPPSSPSAPQRPDPVVRVDVPPVDLDGDQGLLPQLLPDVNLPKVDIPPIRLP